MKTLLRNVRFLLTVDLQKLFDGIGNRFEAGEGELDAHWHAIRVLTGEATGDYLPRKRPGGNDMITRVVKLQSIPLQIAAEVDKVMHPPVKKPRRTRRRTAGKR